MGAKYKLSNYQMASAARIAQMVTRNGKVEKSDFIKLSLAMNNISPEIAEQVWDEFCLRFHRSIKRGEKKMVKERAKKLIKIKQKLADFT